MTYREHMRRCARDYWRRVLRESGNNVSAAARKAGVNRTNAYKLFRRLSITPKSSRKVGRWAEFGL